MRLETSKVMPMQASCFRSFKARFLFLSLATFVCSIAQTHLFFPSTFLQSRCSYILIGMYEWTFVEFSAKAAKKSRFY